MTFMDALVCVEPGNLQLERRPLPKRGDGEVLVRPRMIGICGTDYHIYEGKHPYLQYPRVMGHELAVEVVEAPAGSGLVPGQIMVVNPYLACGQCSACRRGKPNCCKQIQVLGVHRDGGMCELLVLPAINLVSAEGLGLEACAAVEFLAIGAHAVRRSRAGPGGRVLIVGAGPIGLGAALFARLQGAQITIVDTDADRLAGASAVVIDAATRLAGEATTRDLTESFDVVFDATGNRQSMEAGFGFVDHGGRYVFVGVIKGELSFVAPDFHRKEMELLGSRNATLEDFDRVIAAMRNGDIPLDRIITHRTTLPGAQSDLATWASDKAGLIKAMIAV